MPAHWTQQNGSPRHKPRDYAQTPVNIYWEMTQSCSLACRHCRANAMPNPHPNEMTYEQSIAFLRQIPEFGQPMPQLILTGGDPLDRPDLYELIDEARHLGIGVSITPAATARLTKEVLMRLKAHGVEGAGLESRRLDRRKNTIPSAAFPARFNARCSPCTGQGAGNSGAGEHPRRGRNRHRHSRDL